ncbi:hypothetical protein WG74_06360 [Citromicrobium sp. JL477]|nr:hypothetical protein WG74_06360 [Citromicrobium sp. JL477]
MTPTKLLIGQFLVVFALVLAGLWAATRWAAAMLGYLAKQKPMGATENRIAIKPPAKVQRFHASLRWSFAV